MNELDVDDDDVPGGLCIATARLPATKIRQLLKLLHNVFSCMFATDLRGDQAGNRYSAHVMRYLSAYEAIDAIVMKNRTKPIWEAKYGLLGLLRAAEHYSQYGVLRCLHEGADLGEGIVKLLRAICTKGVKFGWSLNLLDRFNRDMFLDHLATTLRPFAWSTLTVFTAN